MTKREWPVDVYVSLAAPDTLEDTAQNENSINEGNDDVDENANDNANDVNNDTIIAGNDDDDEEHGNEYDHDNERSPLSVGLRRQANSYRLKITDSQ